MAQVLYFEASTRQNREYTELIHIGSDFLNRTPMAEQLRERIDKWDFMKLKSFCRTKEMVTRLKRPPTE
jgi:hypothetical protein